MKKNVRAFSISDDVAAEIDKAAMSAGKSRSAICEAILAAGLGVSRPEIGEVANALQAAAGRGRFSIVSSRAAVMRVKTRMKYSPTLVVSARIFGSVLLLGFSATSINRSIKATFGEIFKKYSEASFSACASFYCSDEALEAEFDLGDGTKDCCAYFSGLMREVENAENACL